MNDLLEKSIENKTLTNKRSYFWFKIIDQQLIWFLVAIAILTVSIFMKDFLNLQNISNIIMNSVALGILVIAETFCLLVGKFDLSIESTLGFCGIFGGFLVTRYSMNPAIVIFIILGIGIFIGFFNGLFIVKVGVNPFVQTLSMLIILRGLVVVVAGGRIVYDLPESYRIFGNTKILGIPTPIIILLLLYIFFSIFLEKRALGRKIYITGVNPVAAHASGINVDKINILVFVISGFLAALAGLILSTRLGSIQHTFGKGMIFEVMAAAVIGGISLNGGRGRLIGALGGVLFLGIIGSILVWFNVQTTLVETIKGVIILFAITIDAIKNKVRLMIA